MKKQFFIYLLLLTLFAAPHAIYAQAQQGGRSSSIVSVEGAQYYVHTVEAGETLYSLARSYGVTQEEIVAANPHAAEGLKEGQVLKVPVSDDGREDLSARQLKRNFDQHTVAAGETSYSITRLHGISLATLMEDNPGLDPVSLSPGQKLNVRKKSKGDVQGWQITDEMEEYRDALNKVTDDGQYHFVKSGETLYTLSRTYGVTQEEIRAANNLTDGLKAGAIIKIPEKGTSQADLRAAGAGSAGADRRLWPGRELVGADTSTFDRWSPGGRFGEGGRTAVRDVSAGKKVNVALMLPLRDETGRTNIGFLEFYQGMLLGLEDLKAQGISADLSLYNTLRSQKSIYGIVESPDFAATDLIIGPVYEEGIGPVLEFAEQAGVAVVSPLAVMSAARSPMLYQMPPTQDTKYNKVLAMLSSGANVIYVSTSEPDADMERSLRPQLPAGTQYISYARSTQAAAFRNLLSRESENIFVVSCESEHTVNEILAKLVSMGSNLSSRGIMNPNIRVVGSSKWARYHNQVERDYYFRLRVCYVTSYHADRSNADVYDFDRRYIGAFSGIPTSYAYRGYDAAKLFVGAAATPGADFTRKVNHSPQKLLQMSYDFKQQGPDGDFRNDDWGLVSYNMDYTIQVK